MHRPLILAALLCAAGVSDARIASQAAPSADATNLGGPAVAGVCLLSRQAVFANAKAGQAMIARLRALADEAQTEIASGRAPLEAEVKKYNDEQAKLSPAQREGRQKALRDRLAPIDAKTRLRQREIDATRQKALERIAAEMEPVLVQAYKQRNCGLLVDRSTVLGGNMANDLTATVVQGLDARMPTITFNREILAAVK